MSLLDQIAEAERMQRWDYAQQLRLQLKAEQPLYEPEPAHEEPVDAHDLEEPNPENAAPEGADVTPDAPASDPEE